MTPPVGLGRLNALPAVEAEEVLLGVCSCRVWAEAVAAGRPYADLAGLQRQAAEAWDRLGPAEWREAMAGHPRIGETGGAAPDRSSREQSAVTAAGADVAAALAAGNRAYEARFGHVYLVRAAGRTPAEILADLTARLANDPATELAVAAGQQREITALRLEQLVEEPGP